LSISHKKNNTLNEEETIQLIWKVLSHGKRDPHSKTFDPFSDDVSWFPNSSKKRLVVSKSEILVSDTDVPPQMNPKQIAFKAVTGAVSDFAAKGVKPSFCIISLAIPKSEATQSFVRSLAEGFDSAARKYQLKILSGDTSGSKNGIVVDVALFGFADSIVKRSDAEPGEIVAVSGVFGLQSSGLAILLGKARSRDRSFRVRAKESVLNPKARLSLGLKIGKYLGSCIDSSDGLALSLYHIAESSDVDIHLDSLPIAGGVREFALYNNLNENDLVLFGGEEYELVMTFKPKNLEAIQRSGSIVIGKTTRTGSKRPTVYYKFKKIPRRGWVHNR
jgi:thiamine-monophosphate kinase